MALQVAASEAVLTSIPSRPTAAPVSTPKSLAIHAFTTWSRVVRVALMIAAARPLVDAMHDWMYTLSGGRARCDLGVETEGVDDAHEGRDLVVNASLKVDAGGVGDDDGVFDNENDVRFDFGGELDVGLDARSDEGLEVRCLGSGEDGDVDGGLDKDTDFGAEGSRDISIKSGGEFGEFGAAPSQHPGPDGQDGVDLNFDVSIAVGKDFNDVRGESEVIIGQNTEGSVNIC